LSSLLVRSKPIFAAFCYSVLVTNRRIPTIRTATPMIVNMPAKWLMSPAGGLREAFATIAPMIVSIKPNSFSATNSPMGKFSLMPEPSRFNFTVSRLILIYLSFV